MTRYLRVALLSAEVQRRQLAASLFLLFNALVQPFFIGVTAMFLLRHRPDFEVVYVIVGTGLTGLWTIILFTGAVAITQERGRATLELLATSPVPLMVIVGGQMLANVALALTSLVLSYAIGAWLFGYAVAVSDPAAFGVSLLLTLFSLWSMGMLFAPLAILSPAVDRFLSGLEYPVYILCGFLFPVVLLPGWLLPISYLLPPYWAAVALHGVSSGDLPAGEVIRVWLLLIATNAIVLTLAARLFRVFVDRARRDGTLAHV